MEMHADSGNFVGSYTSKKFSASLYEAAVTRTDGLGWTPAFGNFKVDFYLDVDEFYEVMHRAGLDYRGAGMLISSDLTSINNLKHFYINAGALHGVPWQMIAAVHYRETRLAKSGPANGNGPYQISGKNYPVGAYNDTQFQTATNDAAEFIKGKAGNRNLSVLDNVKYTFFAYNGTAQAYKTQAINIGFTSGQADNGEGSPYVMNRFDLRRDPTIAPTNTNNTWGQIITNGGGLSYPANLDYGAFLVYKALL